jgi:pimeloyl-ACP methyl ester carboxylesterase
VVTLCTDVRLTCVKVLAVHAEEAVKESDEIVKRQGTQIRFRNKDMDFMFNWFLGMGSIVGLSHGELFQLVDGMKDGDAVQWRERFGRHGDFLVARAGAVKGPSAAQDRLAAAFCYRAVLQYSDPTAESFLPMVERMEVEFLEGAKGLGVPLHPVEVPFEGKSLPGYFLEHDSVPRPLVVMIGGGDSYREDLFYFGGYPSWHRGFNMLMVDLPGQGKVPARGLTFRADMAAPISAALDFVAARAKSPPEKVAIYGVSGGGYFTGQSAAEDRRIGAWIASTPITDMAEVFRKEMGATFKAPGWLLRAGLAAAGAVNKSAELNLKKYAWQFGTSDYKSAIDQLFVHARPVNTASISCPCLFLVGACEAAELKRQASALFDELKGRGANVTLRTFLANEGGDAHCQVNNFRLAHSVAFDWLDQVVSPPPPKVDPRLLAW